MAVELTAEQPGRRMLPLEMPLLEVPPQVARAAMQAAPGQELNAAQVVAQAQAVEWAISPRH
jgi:hypothetical protein